MGLKSSHLDQTSLVNKGFIVQQKGFASILIESIMTYRILSNSFCSTINSRNSFMPFLFGLSSTAKTLWLTFQKKTQLVSASRAVFPFLRGIKTGKRKMGSSCPRG